MNLQEILEEHKLWLCGAKGGERANLSGASLSGANLSRASLSGADLSRANLSGANLSRANLSVANLYGADLSGANLSRASLSGANLSGANLSGADLSGANLPHFQICPEEGSFVGWKKLQGGLLAKLRIPEGAKRTSTLVGRKCRAEYVEVLELSEPSYDMHSGSTLYKKGETVRPDKYDGDIRVECTHGIHFFMTRKEAEEY